MKFTFYTLLLPFIFAKDTPCPGGDGDAKCAALQSGSYCMYWKQIPICHGTVTPCSCATCSEEDRHEYCQKDTPGSYCKFWKSVPVCQWSDKPCACSDIFGSSTTSGSFRTTSTSSRLTTRTTRPTSTTTRPTPTTRSTTYTSSTTMPIESTTTVLPGTTTPSPHDWPPHNLPFKVGLYSWVTPDNLFYSFLMDPANVINGDLYIATDGHHFVDIVEKLRNSTKTFSRIYAVYGDNTVFTDPSEAFGFVDNQFDALTQAIFFEGKELGPIGVSFDIENAPNEVLLTIINYAKLLLRDNFPDYKIQIAINGATATQEDGGFYEERGRIADEEVDYALLMSYRNFVTPGDGLLGFLWEDGDVTGLFKRYPGLEKRTTALVTVEGPADGSGEGCHPKVTYATVHAWKKPEILTFGKPNQIIADFQSVSQLAVQGKMTPGGEFGVHQYTMFRCFLWDYVVKYYPEYNKYVHDIYGGNYFSYHDLLAVYCPSEYYRPCEFEE